MLISLLPIREAVRQIHALLQPTSDTPQLDAMVLLGAVTGLDRAALYASDARLTEAQTTTLNALVERRRTGEPIAYLLGQREFYGLEFQVEPGVLVPRPDTEILVEQALGWIQAQQRPLLVADVGTGSGAIAIALAVNTPRIRVYALDIAPEPQQITRSNAQRHGVAERVTVLASDGVAALPEPVDLIVSNPPYTILSAIDANVYDHEPHLALDGGPDGLVIYRRWLPEFAAMLVQRQPTAVFLEIGAWQAHAVTTIAREVWPNAQITVWPDLAGRDRVVAITLTPET